MTPTNRRTGRSRSACGVIAALAVTTSFALAGCSSSSKTTTSTSAATTVTTKAPKKKSKKTGPSSDTNGLGTDPGSDGLGSDGLGSDGLGSDGSNGPSATAVANDAELATPAGYSPDTTSSSSQQQVFVNPNDNSQIWWPGCTYPGTSDTAGSAGQCLNHFGQMAKIGDPSPETFGGVRGTLQEGETAQTTDAPVPLYVVAACLPTYGQHVACAVLATPATGDTIPPDEATAFVTAVDGLSSYNGKS